ncbi:glycosyltransferase family 52 [Acinetobacter calcoaceticus]|uniref:glycosyltransferase family 52 n=1 Tax=Acinetobacter calcoaceticus TaxID=471 RepID=UPI001AEB3AF9|nr:glycosyltransferase family 52 [Acinetobacter calcoaceticus]MBP2605816.1 beta-galactosamide-alpha-2,3-sialyltransferase [Acinetobacter calcoaceticus]
MEHRQKSLIMCVTPLQILIAEKIIQSRPTEDFDVIIFALENNLKFNYYAEKLKKYAKAYWYSHVAYKSSIYNLINFLKLIFQFNLNGFNKRYDNYYLSSIDSRYFQYILSKKTDSSSVFTFDDGTANIVKTSIYYLKNLNDEKKNKIFKSLGIKYFQDDIKSMSKLHYTIYPQFENIIENTKEIKLFHSNVKNKIRDKCLNIFLGQPYEEFDSNLSTDNIEKLMDQLNIDLYFPHPREKNNIKNVETVNTKKIFEDYIVDFLDRNEDCYLNIYTFMSSAALNVKSFDGINIYFIQTNTLISKYPDFFNMLKNHNFTILEF